MANNAKNVVGSEVSLISKFEIRYEGILHSLDLDETTVTISKVKSYGTEDRPTRLPVPPKPEIYEFLTFHGDNLKDFTFLKKPAKPVLLK